MSSEAFRQMAADISKDNTPDHSITDADLATVFWNLADLVDAEPQPTTPNVREMLEATSPSAPNSRQVLELLTTFAEHVAVQGFGMERFRTLAIRLATEARAALAEPETGIVADAATPDVREACTALVAFAETIAGQKRQDGEPSSRSAVARELAKGARSALARPVVKIPEIVDELVAMCETAKGVLDLSGSTGQIGQLTAQQIAGALADVIAKAKGQADG